MEEDLSKTIEGCIKEVERLERKDELIYKIRAHLMRRLKEWEALRKERYKRVPEELKKRILEYDKEVNLIDARMARILIEHVLEFMIAEDMTREEYIKLAKQLPKKEKELLGIRKGLIQLLGDQKMFIKQAENPLKNFLRAIKRVFKETRNSNLRHLKRDIRRELTLIEKFYVEIGQQIALIKKELKPIGRPAA